MSVELYVGSRRVTLEFVKVDESDESAVWSVYTGDEMVYVETGSDPDDTELVEAIGRAIKEES